MDISFLQEHGLDIFTTCLGLLYILLEYRASIWLWAVGIVMPALDVWLYYSHGLYGDAAMAVYYTLAAVWGLWMWLRVRVRAEAVSAARTKPEDNTSSPAQGSEGIASMPRTLYLPAFAFFLIAWGAIYWLLATYTDSTVPVQDAFTNALSFVGLWALSRKFVEQWLFWLIVDAFCCYLYVVKGIPFKALLYGLYTAIAIAGWLRWRRLARQ